MVSWLRLRLVDFAFGVLVVGWLLPRFYVLIFIRFGCYVWFLVVLLLVTRLHLLFGWLFCGLFWVGWFPAVGLRLLRWLVWDCWLFRLLGLLPLVGFYHGWLVVYVVLGCLLIWRYVRLPVGSCYRWLVGCFVSGFTVTVCRLRWFCWVYVVAVVWLVVVTVDWLIVLVVVCCRCCWLVVGCWLPVTAFRLVDFRLLLG